MEYDLRSFGNSEETNENGPPSEAIGSPNKMAPDPVTTDDGVFNESETNPWNSPENIKVLDLGKPINKSRSPLSPDSTVDSRKRPGTFRIFQLSRTVNRSRVLGLLTITSGGLIGILIAIFLANIDL